MTVLKTVVQDGDIVLTLGAGSIGAFAVDFLQQCSRDSKE
jgi:UDP-N-acetylmuramate-alanine ligase